MRQNKWRIVGIVLLGVGVIALLFFYFWKEVEIPQEVGKKQRYQAEDALEEAMQKLSLEQEALKLESVQTLEKVVSITLEGVGEEALMQELAVLFKENGIKPVFFMDGIKSAEDPKAIKVVSEQGYEIGNYTLSAEKALHQYEEETLIQDLVRANIILEEITGVAPTLLKANGTKYEPNVRRAAKAASLNEVVETDYFLSYQSLTTKEQALNFVQGIKRGSILSIKVNEVLDETEYNVGNQIDPTREEEKPAIDKAPSLQGDTATLNKQEQLIRVVKLLLSALQGENYKVIPIRTLKAYEDMDFEKTFIVQREENKGALAPVIHQVATTSRSVAITFRDLSDTKQLNDILDFLQDHKVTATFFVTGYETVEKEEEIKKILAKGHNVENGGLTGEALSGKTYDEIAFEINKTHNLLKEKFNIEAQLFMPVYGKYDEIVREVVSSLGYTLMTYTKNPFNDKTVTAEQVGTYISKGFQRGEIVYFPLAINKEVKEGLKVVIDKVRQSGYGFLSANQLYKRAYRIRNGANIPGFNGIKRQGRKSDIENPEKQIIHSIDTEEKVVFLTFDDWGSDQKVTRILDILANEQVKASFFLRVNGVDKNPNLARAISVAGHEIGNHTYNHNIITQIPKEQLLGDVIKAHQRLTIAIDRQPELFFRPPTLTTSQESLEAILEAGFKYVILGNVSTHDYEFSADQVIEEVLERVEPGAIIIMHISDNSSATQALPTIIKELKDTGYTFGELSDYLK